jgi:hypothetical protein
MERIALNAAMSAAVEAWAATHEMPGSVRIRKTYIEGPAEKLALVFQQLDAWSQEPHRKGVNLLLARAPEQVAALLPAV